MEIKTCELVEELQNREGVQHIWVNGDEELEIRCNDKKQALEVNKGPIRVLVIWD